MYRASNIKCWDHISIRFTVRAAVGCSEDQGRRAVKGALRREAGTKAKVTAVGCLVTTHTAAMFCIFFRKVNIVKV
jgi:hypothetical protein